MPTEAAIHQHQLALRVYWEDTDAGGIVYYANYLKFMERGRSEMVRAAGIDQNKLLNEGGIVFAVKRCLVDYLLPAKLGDDLQVASNINKLGGASLEMHQKVMRDGVELVTATVRLACISTAGKPVQLPVEVRRLLDPMIS